MSRADERRVGRSETKRRSDVLSLKQQSEANPRRYQLSVEQLRRARERLERRLASGEDQRRAEDRIREEYHDSRARIVGKSA
jgi:hypothetical protein